MGLHTTWIESERENIWQDDISNFDYPARSPSFPVHSIPLVLLVALTITAVYSFGALRERFLAAVSAKSNVATTSNNGSVAISGGANSTQPLDLAHNLDLNAFTPEVQRWGVQIDRWAETYALPPELVAIVMQIESCGDPTAVSSAGARGLFQVMPFHFGADEDWKDSEVNAARGMAYLSRSYQLSNGNIDLTLAGYNGGHSVITRHPSTWPNETQRYVYWGTGILGDIRGEIVPSITLNEWLIAGGDHLCRQAADVSILPYSQSRHSNNGSAPIG